MSGEKKGCLFGFLGLFSSSNRESSTETDSLPYRRREDFLSSAELSFYKVLKLAVGDEFLVLAKVSMNDLLFVQGKGIEKSKSQAYRNKISKKHVDFVLCEPETMQPQLVVELDDSSHSTEKAKESDDFKNSAFAAAELPLLRIPAKRSYSLEELNGKISGLLETDFSSGTQKPDREIVSGEQLCPKCGAKMIVKKAKKGPRTGEKFLGCTNFPKCRAIISMN